jgi:hypothetical protein
VKSARRSASSLTVFFSSTSMIRGPFGVAVEPVGQIDRRRGTADHTAADQDGVVLGALLTEQLPALPRVLVDVGGVVGDRELAEPRRPLLLLLVVQVLPVSPERLLGHEVEVERLLHGGLEALEAAAIAELLGLRDDLRDRRIEAFDRLGRRFLGARGRREHGQQQRGDGGHVDAGLGHYWYRSGHHPEGKAGRLPGRGRRSVGWVSPARAAVPPPSRAPPRGAPSARGSTRACRRASSRGPIPSSAFARPFDQ